MKSAIIQLALYLLFQASAFAHLSQIQLRSEEPNCDPVLVLPERLCRPEIGGKDAGARESRPGGSSRFVWFEKDT
jgi:hypothetical protein